MDQQIITLTPHEEDVFEKAAMAFHSKVGAESDIRGIHVDIKDLKKILKQKSKKLGRLSRKFAKQRIFKTIRKLKHSRKDAKKMLAEAKALKREALIQGGEACRDRIMRCVFGLECEHCGHGKKFLTVLEAGSFCAGCIERGNTTPMA